MNRTIRKYARLVRVANKTKGENGMLACYNLANALAEMILSPHEEFNFEAFKHYSRARKLIRAIQ